MSAAPSPQLANPFGNVVLELSGPTKSCALVPRYQTLDLGRVLAEIVPRLEGDTPALKVLAMSSSIPEVELAANLFASRTGRSLGKDVRFNRRVDPWSGPEYPPVLFSRAGCAHLVDFCSRNSESPTLVVVVEPQHSDPSVDAVLALARYYAEKSSGALLVVPPPERAGRLSKWLPGLQVFDAPWDFSTRRGTSGARRFYGATIDRIPGRNSEIATLEVLISGCSPYAVDYPSQPSREQIHRSLEGLRLLDLLDPASGEPTPLAVYGMHKGLSPRVAAMAGTALSFDERQSLIVALAITNDPPVRSRDKWFADARSNDLGTYDSDLAVAAEAFVRARSQAETTRDNCYLEETAKLATHLASMLQVSAALPERVDRAVLAVVVTHGYIDHLAVACGNRHFRSVFFPEDGQRKLYRSSSCADSDFVVGIPYNPPSDEKVEREPRIHLPTAVTTDVLDAAFEGCVASEADWREAPHLTSRVRPLRITVGSRTATLFEIEQPTLCKYSVDHIVESSGTLYVSGMQMTLDRKIPRVVDVHVGASVFTEAALATMTCATGSVLRCSTPVRFILDGSPPLAAAVTWEDVLRRLRARGS